METRKLQITPYYLQLIRNSVEKNRHTVLENPLFRQVIPYWEEEGDIDSGYDGSTDNWELDHEMKTSICQHKYDDRVIIRLSNTCNAYCQFCYEALRTLDISKKKDSFGSSEWKKTLAYIKNTQGIREVILSGGEPLMLKDEKLSNVLKDIRSISPDLLIRIHTRALTFNPYRVTDQLIEAMKVNRVTSVGIHVCHPDEITSEFTDAVAKLHDAVKIVFSNMPLLGGINDDEDTLINMFTSLYRIGVKPYYLYHFMPFSPGREEYFVSVSRAVELMGNIKRRVTNMAVPEYVLPHAKGKYTVPLDICSDTQPYFAKEESGNYFIFKNWQGEICKWRCE